MVNEFASKELRTVGNYQLGRLIGKGSFGKVYLASHKLTNGSKVVLKSANKSDTNLAREIHHHRQFFHPHICRLYEVIITEHLVWLVLEYCPGDELYNHLIEHGRMEPAKVQKIFTQLIGAVSYVHNKSCVHRDLKLENILLDKHENVKLVDFGFTREYEGKSSYLQTWCGTVCYSAPEMLKGEKYAGEKVDVWSLGIILYALLVGELPFDEGDDEAATKAKILKDEPKYPENFPPSAKELCVSLLSKRPLLRPSLSDILKHPWLADHAPQQQEILKVQQPPPFTTELEKSTLQRMRSAGVDIDTVIENVLAQRCDSLAGWWALLIEKEERKEKRRQRKRKEREAEAKSLRRISGASGRLMTPSLKEIDEEGQHATLIGDPPKTRGRNMRRTDSTTAAPELSHVPEGGSRSPDITKPAPIEKTTPRSTSSSRSRPPPPPPKDVYVRRSSNLQLVQTNPDLLNNASAPNGYAPKRRRKIQQPFFQQLASLKSWLKESTKRARSPHTKNNNSTQPKRLPTRASQDRLRRTSTGPLPHPRRSSASQRPDLHTRSTFPAPHHQMQQQQQQQQQRPRVSTTSSTSSIPPNNKRTSLSPSPLTPHSSFRRVGSGGLRGRKSTSSSVSSIRSIHGHRHSASKASSTSSASAATASRASLASPSSASAATKPGRHGSGGRSPHHASSSSVKVLPSTPTAASSFPTSIRIVRGFGGGGGGGGGGGNSTNNSNNNSESAAAFGSFGMPPPASPGLVFARRKRTPFKGPMMIGTHGTSPSGRGREGMGQGGSRSGSVQGRRSGEVIAEEDEEEEGEEMEDGDEDGEGMMEEEEVEEVEAFSPVEAGDFVEIEEDEAGEGANGRVIGEEEEGVEGDDLQAAVDMAAQKAA
ncbi:MAG: hypothetical protein M1821_006526 [Bathelium mastoideum]|nr:MAG: hypothetical protein M1821_006526 [Bathelium mastoideum]